jgi:colicin import membrane protein
MKAGLAAASRWLQACLALGLGAGAPVWAQMAAPVEEPPSAPQVRRQVLEQQRLAVEAQHRAAAALCEQRFAINACLADADQARRQALAPLRQESLALDDAERQSRAMARAHQAAQRQQGVAQRVQAATLAASGPRDERATALVPSSPRPAAPVLSEPEAVVAPRAGPSAEATALAMQRAAAAEKRRAQAAADRERIAAKQAERARQSASSPGLPVPQQPFKP